MGGGLHVRVVQAIQLKAWMWTETVDCRSSFLSAAECLDVSVRVRASGEEYVKVCALVCMSACVYAFLSVIRDLFWHKH